MDNKTFDDLGVGELRPGVTPRRWEPEEGVNRLNNKIHKESKIADDHKNLPFSFSKPYKPKGRLKRFVCNNCGHLINGSSVTVGVICSNCNKFSTVSEVDK